MIGKLRKKFILINMLLVGLVLLVVCAAFCISSYQNLESESIGALKQATGRRHGEDPPRLEVGGKRPDKPFTMVPVFVVDVAEDGSIAAVRGDQVEVSAETLAIIVKAAVASTSKIGILNDYQLRYLVEDAPDGVHVAFADRGRELNSMAGVLLTALAAFVAALGAMFAASVYLARWALRPVERAWKQQQQFVADASHELKTPLTVILANMGILLGKRSETIAAQAKWVENTLAEAVRMKKLVDDLLFLAKSDAARTPCFKIPLNVSDLLWSAVLPFESLAFERGVALESDISPELWTTGDEGQLRQLAAILLDNACKYADAGGTVTVRLRRQQDRVILRVHNTGPVLPEEDRARLFERFYRADTSRAREHGGYGLGLAIAKSIVEAHSGRIAAENRDGGVEFTVLLSYLPPDKSDQESGR